MTVTKQKKEKKNLWFCMTNTHTHHKPKEGRITEIAYCSVWLNYIRKGLSLFIVYCSTEIIVVLRTEGGRVGRRLGQRVGRREGGTEGGREGGWDRGTEGGSESKGLRVGQREGGWEGQKEGRREGGRDRGREGGCEWGTEGGREEIEYSNIIYNR